MNNFNEADHPRDNIGRFTYKDGSSSSTQKESEEQKMQRRADLLYPTMKDKSKDIKDISYYELKNFAKTENDRNFFMSLDIVFSSEGKYVNNPDDKGGPTNMGVTQSTYNDYCIRHNMPIKNVKQLSKNEVIQVYYNDFWKKLDLDKENNPIKSLILFDTAVLHGVGGAKEIYKKSNGNLNKVLEIRREHYRNKVRKEPKQKQFEKGWYNRINRLEKILNRYQEINKENH